MSFPKIVNEMGSFGEKRKKLFFRLCRPILDIFGFPLLIGRSQGIAVNKALSTPWIELLASILSCLLFIIVHKRHALLPLLLARSALCRRYSVIFFYRKNCCWARSKRIPDPVFTGFTSKLFVTIHCEKSLVKHGNLVKRVSKGFPKSFKVSKAGFQGVPPGFQRAPKGFLRVSNFWNRKRFPRDC